MSFISTSFAIFFLIFVVLYYALSKAQQKFSVKGNRFITFLLFTSSIVYYAFADVHFIPILLLIVTISYFGGFICAKGNCNRIVFFLIIFADLLPLLSFKYNTHFSIMFPLGLSFYTFQSIGYLADVYKKKIPCEKNFFALSAFITFFPSLSSGPIQRAENLLPQLKTVQSFNYDHATDGMKLFAWGMFKKLIIADKIAIYVNYVYASGERMQGSAALLAAILYSFQIYCDFSGYSDMAIGIARFLGFDVSKNFDHPYLSKSVGEFWRRWHISLSSWLRDYVYIALGGSRVALPRIYLNLLLTFLVSGIWHGSTINFLIWGLFYGIILCIERATKNTRAKIKMAFHISDTNRIWNAFCVLFTFSVVTFLWIFFRAENISVAMTILKKIANIPNELSSKINIRTLLLLDDEAFGGFTGLFKLFIVLFCFIAISIFTRHRSGLSFVKCLPSAVRWGLYFALLVIIFESSLSSSSNFIYNNF